MAMRYAQISGGQVVNLIEVDPANVPSDLNAVAAPADVEIGWSYDGTDFSAPPEPSDEQLLDAERAKMAVYGAAFTLMLKMFPPSMGPYAHALEQVEATVTTARKADPFANLVIWYDRVTIFLRAHPDMEVFRVAFGAGPLALDQMFRVAIKIENEGVSAVTAEDLVIDYAE